MKDSEGGVARGGEASPRLSLFTVEIDSEATVKAGEDGMLQLDLRCFGRVTPWQSGQTLTIGGYQP